MLATIDRPVETDASNLPRVTFDREGHVIQATVILSRGKDPDSFHHDVYPLSAVGRTGSNWTVIWTLAPSAGVSAYFIGKGIVPKSVPKGVDDHHSEIYPPGSSQAQPTQWQLSFTGNVTDVNVIRYDLELHVQDTERNVKLKRSKDIVIDPTIAVVKDPVDG
jgi:hypothetical protein